MKVIKIFLIVSLVYTFLMVQENSLASEEKLVPPEDFTYFVTRDSIKIYYQEIKPEETMKGTRLFPGD